MPDSILSMSRLVNQVYYVLHVPRLRVEPGVQQGRVHRTRNYLNKQIQFKPRSSGYISSELDKSRYIKIDLDLLDIFNQNQINLDILYRPRSAGYI